MATSRSFSTQSLGDLRAPDEGDFAVDLPRTRSVGKALAPLALLAVIFGAAAYLVWVLALIAAQGSALRWVGIGGLVAVGVATFQFVASHVLTRRAISDQINQTPPSDAEPGRNG